jgi:uncharacterized protein YndB with AHSA1/START domain
MMSEATQFRHRWIANACIALVCVLCFGAPVRAADAAPLVAEGFVNAPTAEVWSLFTTSEGYRKTGVAHAQVDLTIGGEIRTHYDPKGRLGDPETIVNEILAYEPERMLAIRVKQPPASFPHRAALAGTWTVLYFAPAGENMTQVRIVGLGYDSTDASQALRKFFEEGNRWTLDHIAKQYWPQCPRCKKEAGADGG